MRRIIRPGAFFLLLIAVLALSGCKKDQVYDDAVITGYDYRVCLCCGGVIINFDEQTDTFPDTFYLVRNMPDNSGISAESEFPVFVRVDWSFVDELCGGDSFIDIHSLKMR